jgi:hypothetical protein
MSSHPASMLTPHGEKHSGKAMPNPAHVEGKPHHGDAGWLSQAKAYRQSPDKGQPDPRPGHCGSGAGGPSESGR